MAQLLAHRALIEKLKPLIFADDFESVFQRLTQDVEKSERFLIKMELKRLATSCQRILDLRSKSADTIKEFDYQGLTHYLTPMAIMAFRKSLKIYQNHYTMGVYEDVITAAQKEKQAHQIDVSSGESKAKDRWPDLAHSRFNLPHSTLGERVLRNAERLQVATTVALTPDGIDTVVGTTSDLSLKGMKVRVPQPFKLQLNKKLAIQFVELDGEEDLCQGEFEFLGVDRQNSRYQWLRFKRIDNEPHLSEQLETLLERNRRKYKIDTDAVERSTLCHGCEDILLDQLDALALFVSQSSPEKPPQSIELLQNAQNPRLHAYWQDENGNSLLANILTPLRLKQLQQTGKILLFSFQFANAQRQLVFCATPVELRQHNLLSLFMAYGSRRDSWRVWQLESHPADIALATRASHIPDSGAYNSAELNAQIEQQIAQFDYVMSMREITSPTLTLHLKELPLQQQLVNQLQRFRVEVPELQPKVSEYQFVGLRRFPRYILRQELVVNFEDQQYAAQCKNFSQMGLQLQAEPPLPLNSGDIVQLGFPELKGMERKLDLMAVPYEVVAADPQVGSVSLRFHNSAEAEPLQQWFQRFITANKDNLRQIPEQPGLSGMTQALANLCTSTITGVQFFITRHGPRWQVSHLASNARNNPLHDLLLELSELTAHLDEGQLNATPLLRGDRFNQTQLRQLKVAKGQSPPLHQAVWLKIQRDPQGRLAQIDTMFVFEDTPLEQCRDFIRLAQKNGEFMALQSRVQRKRKRPHYAVQDALYYLHDYAPHKAQALENQLESMVGCGEWIDVTQACLYQMKIALQARGS